MYYTLNREMLDEMGEFLRDRQAGETCGQLREGLLLKVSLFDSYINVC